MHMPFAQPVMGTVAVTTVVGCGRRVGGGRRRAAGGVGGVGGAGGTGIECDDSPADRR